MVDQAMSKRVYEIDGNAFDDLEGFFDEIHRRLLTAPSWSAASLLFGVRARIGLSVRLS